MDPIEIHEDQSFVQTIITKKMPEKWSPDQHKPYKLTTIDPNSNEFINIEETFSSTVYIYDMKKLERVENPYLLAHYILKKEKLMEENDNVSERFLFHATKSYNVDAICTNNFDWRLNGSSRGVKFGQGVSFSPSAYYAHHFGNVMFMVRVLIGRSTVGNMLTKVPPEPYDTTTNGKDTVYVKYEDDDFYPEYLIHYK